jgi:hypothetical protein
MLLLLLLPVVMGLVLLLLLLPVVIWAPLLLLAGLLVFQQLAVLTPLPDPAACPAYRLMLLCVQPLCFMKGPPAICRPADASEVCVPGLPVWRQVALACAPCAGNKRTRRYVQSGVVCTAPDSTAVEPQVQTTVSITKTIMMTWGGGGCACGLTLQCLRRLQGANMHSGGNPHQRWT